MDRWLHYDLAEKLGEGPSGTTWQAYDLGLERIVTLKLFRPEVQYEAEASARVIRRLHKLCIENPNQFSEVYAWEVNSEQQYQIREFVSGKSMELYLGRPMLFSEFLTASSQLAESLDILHASNLVHGQIKANNIIIGDAGEKPRIVDVGNCLIPGGQRISDIVYHSPELIAGKAPSESSDLYALGILFYRMLTGLYPFKAEDPEEMKRVIMTGHADMDSPEVKRLPPEALLLLKKLVAQDPLERFRDTEQLLVTLREVTEKLDPAVPTPPDTPHKVHLTPLQYLLFSLVVLFAIIVYFTLTSAFN